MNHELLAAGDRISQCLQFSPQTWPIIHSMSLYLCGSIPARPQLLVDGIAFVLATEGWVKFQGDVINRLRPEHFHAPCDDKLLSALAINFHQSDPVQRIVLAESREGYRRYKHTPVPDAPVPK